jgi:Cu-processing system permease protein
VKTVAKVLGYGLSNLVRNWWVLGYGLLFLLLTDALFRFGGGGPRVVASLMNVVLIVIPLVSVVFGTLHFSNSREFIELLLAQPVGRPALFTGLYFGLALPLAAAFAVGVAVPALGHGGAELVRPVATLVAAGVLLTFVFTSVAFLAGVHFEDRAKGLGFALLVWFCSAVLYDGLILLVAMVFRDYPLESALLGLTVFNPVDLARVLLLLTFDTAALMGYTGAVFERFFGTALGIAAAAVALLLWTVVPFVLGLRGFNRKDF